MLSMNSSAGGNQSKRSYSASSPDGKKSAHATDLTRRISQIKVKQSKRQASQVALKTARASSTFAQMTGGIQSGVFMSSLKPLTQRE